jgi:hypothetical protein
MSGFVRVSVPAQNIRWPTLPLASENGIAEIYLEQSELSGALHFDVVASVGNKKWLIADEDCITFNDRPASQLPDPLNWLLAMQKASKVFASLDFSNPQAPKFNMQFL